MLPDRPGIPRPGSKKLSMRWLWLLPNLLLLGDWARNRREVQWFFVLALFGPLGAAAYLMYFWESITFPFPLASTVRAWRGGRTAKRCHRCQQLSYHTRLIVDGRSTHLMCNLCAAEVEARRSR